MIRYLYQIRKEFSLIYIFYLIRLIMIILNQREREIQMNEIIERMMREKEIEIRFSEENQEMRMKISEYRELIDSDEFEKEFKILKKSEREIQIRDKKNRKILNIFIIQIHESRDRDIKIKSDKIDEFNLKLIYHRKSNSDKEFRIFISFYDENKKLRRKRLINSDIKKIDSDESKMIEFFDSLIEKKEKEYIKKYI